MTRTLLSICTLAALTTMLSSNAAAKEIAKKDPFNILWKRSSPPTHSERLERAGDPFCISPWAKCSPGKYDYGYYVGGGARKKGEGRYWHEGTWGFDYNQPGTRTHLGWYHGRRHQGGEGQYEPDEKNNPTSDFFNK